MAKKLSAVEQFKNRQQPTLDPEELITQIVKVLDEHDGDSHVSAIEHLMTPKAIHCLKQVEILEMTKYYTPRQAAAALWLGWRG